MGAKCTKSKTWQAVSTPGSTLLGKLGPGSSSGVGIGEEEEKSRPQRQHRITHVIGKSIAHAGDGPAQTELAGAGDCNPVESTEDLSTHRRSRSMGAGTKELIRNSMGQDRLCALLGDEEVDMVLETMEYFEFAANEPVVKQGEVGSTFFIVEEGVLSVSVNGNPANTLGRGSTFGALALLYRCPRTASVTATCDSGCWGASGSTFNKVLRENAKRRYDENRKFLESIHLFEGLTEKQKDTIATGVAVETFDKGARVLNEGEAAVAIYFARRGELEICKGGRVAATGELVGGTRGPLPPGECFGDRELLRGEKYSASVLAAGKCELLSITKKHLQEVLGQNVQACLEKALICSATQKSGLSEFPPSQQEAMIEAMGQVTFAAGERVTVSDLRFAAVLEGMLLVQADAGENSISRGGWYEEDVALSESSPRGGARPMRTAGPEGCRLAVLRREGFAQALIRCGTEKTEGQAIDFARKMVLLRKVHVFRHLSHEQTETVVRSLLSRMYKQGDMVIKQGEIGTAFFVIASGEVRVTIDGKVVRTMGKNACLGERALLFDEPRTASVEVVTEEAEIWSVEKTVFSQIVKGKMQQQLTERIKLQDTSVTLKDLVHVKLIGAGASGSVRLVQHANTGTRYALKRVNKKRGRIPDEVQRERELLAENDHPFVMTFVKTLETQTSVYLLTEVITGGELHGAIRTIPTVLTRAQAQFYTGSLLLVIEELAGRNIIYRDLKPENVMLDAQGYLKLVDFGIAKKLRNGNLKSFTIIGTPHYMAPEILQGRGYGMEVDIWSLGVLLYEFVCGYLPFADDLDNPTEVCQAVLKEALRFPSRYRDAPGKSLMTGMLRRNPMERLGSGLNGHEDIKAHEFFSIGHAPGGCLFEKIIGRELDPPVVPQEETYTDPAELVDIRLDDAGELHR